MKENFERVKVVFIVLLLYYFYYCVYGILRANASLSKLFLFSKSSFNIQYNKVVVVLHEYATTFVELKLRIKNERI